MFLKWTERGTAPINDPIFPVIVEAGQIPSSPRDSAVADTYFIVIHQLGAKACHRLLPGKVSTS
jgi:hypothetical protein